MIINNVATVCLINRIVTDYDFVRSVSGLKTFLNRYLILFYIRRLGISSLIGTVNITPQVMMGNMANLLLLT